MDNYLTEILSNSLNGENAHVNPLIALEGLDEKTAGAKGLNTPHTVWQLLKHLNYWNKWFLNLLETGEGAPPKTASEGWVEEFSPANENELSNEIELFAKYLEKAKSHLNNSEMMNAPKGKYKSGCHVIQGMSNHVSYHVGEIVFLRRILGAWPPPSGGDTW